MNPLISVSFYIIMHIILMVGIRACLYSVLAPGKARRNICIAVLAVFACLTMLPVLGALLPDNPFKFRLQAYGNIWLGFDVYFIMCMLNLSVLTFIIERIRKRRFYHGAGVILAVSTVVGLGTMAYGMVHAQHTILTHLSLESEKPLGADHKLRIALIGDLHMSVNSKPETIWRMVELMNQEQPDVVLIAGDILTSSYPALKNPEEYAAALRGLQSRFGVYAVYGNHDVEETLFGGFPISPISKAFRTKEIEQFFRDCGFTALYDEITEIADGAVQIAGRVDGEKAGDGTAQRMSAEELLAGADPAKPLIVLEHESIDFSNLAKCGADLVLCGHTHAGQIFPGNLIVPFFSENAYGLKTIDGMDTVVTSGIGYYGPPMRVGTNSEIMIIDLTEK